jgi:spore germination cell wall hydrolase CwlJ-like protein
MVQQIQSFGFAALMAMLLTGCVSGENPKSSLSINSASMPATAAEMDVAFANLPDSGPAPQERPDILSLASGAFTNADETKAEPVQKLAMIEPETQPDSIEPSPLSAPNGEPIVASNRERDCLMRAMYFESNRSSPDGLLSVGTVVMHRLESGTWGKSICGVVGAPRQFAPGALSRRMEGDLTDLQALADQIIAGRRQPKLAKNVMYFHVAGMKFPYKNMRYVHVAGGNTFYYKAQRKRRA